MADRPHRARASARTLEPARATPPASSPAKTAEALRQWRIGRNAIVRADRSVVDSLLQTAAAQRMPALADVRVKARPTPAAPWTLGEVAAGTVLRVRVWRARVRAETSM